MQLSKPFQVIDVARHTNGTGYIVYLDVKGTQGTLTFQESPPEITQLVGKALHLGEDGGLAEHMIYLGNYHIMSFVGNAAPDKRLRVEDVIVSGAPGWLKYALSRYQDEGILKVAEPGRTVMTRVTNPNNPSQYIEVHNTKREPVRVLFVDVETTGLDAGLDQLLQVAAVPVVDGRVLPKDEWLNVWIKYPRYYLSHGVAASEEFLKNVRKSATEGTEEAKALGQISDYFEGQRKLAWEGVITVGGKNFWRVDGPFLETFGVETDRLFHHRSIDIGNLYARPSDRVLPNLEQCLDRSSVDKSQWNPHDAVSDARACAGLYCEWYSKGGR